MRTPAQLASGRWKITFRIGKKVTSETFDSKREAEDFAKLLDALGPHEALDRLYAGEQQQGIPTLGALATEHIDSLHHAEPGTRTKYRRLWDRTWGPRIGETRIDRVSLDLLSKTFAELAADYSEKSLKNQRGLLMGVLDRAVAEKHIPANPAKRRLRMPSGAVARHHDDMRILTPDEFSVLIKGIHEHYRPLVRFLFGTGCRWGEAVALEVGDVRLPNVTIRRAEKYSPGEYRVAGPKTKRGRRTIALPVEIQADLKSLTEGRESDALVFTAPEGGRVRHRTFWDRYWREAAEKVPAPRPRIHDLRHSHASWLLGRGVPIHVVQARLGHESIKTTVDTYSHLLPDAQKMAADAAALAFSSGPLEIA
jgi:integrase